MSTVARDVVGNIKVDMIAPPSLMRSFVADGLNGCGLFEAVRVRESWAQAIHGEAGAAHGDGLTVALLGPFLDAGHAADHRPPAQLGPVPPTCVLLEGRPPLSHEVSALYDQGISGLFGTHEPLEALAFGLAIAALGRSTIQDAGQLRAPAPDGQAARRPATVGRAYDFPGLSQREKELLLLIAEGLSNDEIAAQLHLAATSVKSYVSRLYTKMGVRDRSQLMALTLGSRPAMLPAVLSGSSIHHGACTPVDAPSRTRVDPGRFGITK